RHTRSKRDWSSDVCSSDLEEVWLSAHHIIGNVKDAQTGEPIIDAKIIAVATEGLGGGIGYSDGSGNYDVKINRAVYTVSVFADEIGRASCRERVADGVVGS